MRGAKLKLKQAKGKASVVSKAAKETAVQYAKYDVTGAAEWEEGRHVPYKYLARVFSEVEPESKRLKIQELLANAFRTVIAEPPVAAVEAEVTLAVESADSESADEAEYADAGYGE